LKLSISFACGLFYIFIGCSDIKRLNNYMFARDYNTLNELYDTKIIKENVGLGPLADNNNTTPSNTQAVRIKMPPKRTCGGEEEENTSSEDCEGHDPDSYDSNGRMARQLLFRVHKLSAMLHDLLNNKDNIEAWVLSKITNAHDQIASVFGYEDYEAALNSNHGMCGDNLEENNEEELFKKIDAGGLDILDLLKSKLSRESKETLEKVLLETIILLEKKSK
jgi:hypothetical protein